MKRKRLRNRFLKYMSDLNRVAYNTQRKHCIFLVRKAKKSYYSNLDHKKIVGEKHFKKLSSHILRIKVSNMIT